MQTVLRIQFSDLQAAKTALLHRCPCRAARHVVFTRPQDKGYKNENLISCTSPCPNVHFQSGSASFGSLSSALRCWVSCYVPMLSLFSPRALLQKVLTQSLPFLVYLNHYNLSFPRKFTVIISLINLCQLIF